MKKMLVSLLCVSLLLGFAGCKDAGIYREAGKVLEAGNYPQVIELLDTIPEYEDKDGLREYANAAIAFQDAVKYVDDNNAEIDAIVTPAQELLNSDRISFDDSLPTTLQLAISELREMKRETADMPVEVAAILSETERLSAPFDFSVQEENVQNAAVALENSMKQMEQITNPTGDFVIGRLNNVPDIEDIAGVTEDNDPNGRLNKQGGYTSATYFSTLLIDQSNVYGDGLIGKGTDAGGCIEVYANVEDATAREAYLAAFDGSGLLSSGSHVVFGTIVIRTSNELTATQQRELTEQIEAVLIELR